MPTIQLWALIVGIALGGSMIIVSCYVYAKTQRFGAGGPILTALGTILIGLSIFSSVNFSVSPKDGFKFETQIYKVAKDAATDAIKETTKAAIKEEIAVADVPRPSRAHHKSTLSPASEVQDKPQTTSAAPTAPETAAPKTLASLQLQERVQRLIDSKDYQEAMKLDPTNVIPVMYYIEENVLRGKYAEAAAAFPALQKNDASGVGYSAYPDVVIAFDHLGRTLDAAAALTELKNRIAQDITQGYGYLSRSQQLEWVDTSLAKSASLVTNSDVKQQIGALRDYIKTTISMLRG